MSLCSHLAIGYTTKKTGSTIIKTLFYSESPCLSTSFAQLSRHFLPFLASLGEVECVVTNHLDLMPYNQDEYPYEMHLVPTSSIVTHEGMNPFSYVETNEDTLLNFAVLEERILYTDYDLLFLINDLQVLSRFREAIDTVRKKRDIRVVVYSPIDCDANPPPLFDALYMADLPVLYSRYAHRVVKKFDPTLAERCQVIYHGTEPEVFYPLTEAERRFARSRMFGIHDDETFLVVNVNRNQFRKDLGRTMAAFHTFYKQHPNSLLYLHARYQDVGGSLPAVARLLGLDVDGHEVMFAPSDFTAAKGFSRAALNRVYNAADVIVTTSLGEGFGLVTTEAMAAGRPIVAPDNTTFPELLGSAGERGYLVDCGGPSLWDIRYGHSEQPRPLTSVRDLVYAIEEVYHGREEADERGQAARDWALTHTWEHVLEEWKALLVS